MASRGDREAARAMAQLLDPAEHHSDWALLIATLRRVLDGERGDQLFSNLDRIDATIVRRALDALAGRIDLSHSASEIWTAQMLVFEALPMTPLLAAARSGDQRVAEMLDRILNGRSCRSYERARVAAALRRISLGEPGNDVMASIDPPSRRVVSGACCVGPTQGLLNPRRVSGVRLRGRARRRRPSLAGSLAPRRPTRNVLAAGSGRRHARR